MVNNEIAILIESFFNSKGFKDAVNQVAQLKQLVMSSQNQLSRFNKIKAFGSNTKEIDEMNGYLSEFGFIAKKSGAIVSKSTGRVANAMQLQTIATDYAEGGFARYQKSFTKLDNILKKPSGFKDIDKFMGKITKNGKAVGKAFAMEFLGIMFFGMMLKQAFESLAKSTVGSFMKITEGMTSSGQAVNSLYASMELLKFSIGSGIASVLESLLPVLLPIIMAISDWVQQNQKLTGWIVISAIVLGTFLFLLGQMWLGLTAAKQAFGTISTHLLKFSNLLGLSRLTMVGWIGLVMGIIGVIALLAAIWGSNWGSIQEYVKSTLGIIWQMLKTVFSDLVVIFFTFFQIIKALFKGDWKTVWELTKYAGSKIFEIILKLLGGIGMLIINAGIFIINLVKDIFFAIADVIHWFMLKIIEACIWVGKQIAKGLLTPLNWAMSAIKGIINGVAKGLEALGATKLAGNLRSFSDALQLPSELDIDAAADALNTLAKQQYEAQKATLQKWDDKLTIGYLNGDDFKAMSQWISDHNQFAKNFDTAAFGIPDLNGEGGMSTALSSLTSSLDALTTKSAESQLVSESLSEQNRVETESWLSKADSLKDYNEELKRTIDLQKTISDVMNTTGQNSFGDDVPNFVGNSLN